MQCVLDAEPQLHAFNYSGSLLLAKLNAHTKIQICILAAEPNMMLHICTCK